MLNGCLKADELLELTGYDRLADLRRSFDAQGIRYHLGKGGKPWTTIDLINAAAGLAPANSEAERPLGPDDV
ncbi:DUF4224 domain-containing protein [Luteibacter sahnii]|uniref:DUF4224 domain-containing protein n=1 Tax=Luteibacter sahnii TaxID=3021977 RepID=UPI002A69BAE1|nr:DUF4224 domain-containing protein [Luteibacter sp. PPL193]MDY1547867.1 DUF4224 domain-containing protein [Luteibacter sp. PPL193]